MPQPLEKFTVPSTEISPVGHVQAWVYDRFVEFGNHATDPKIRELIDYKWQHTIHVVQYATLIAEKWPQASTQALQVAAWAHDLGRAPQILVAGTFSDTRSGIDHAHVSAELISLCPVDFSYRQDVIQAVRVHSQRYPEIENDIVHGLRDADQLALLQHPQDMLGTNGKTPNHYQKTNLNPQVLAQFINGEVVDSGQIVSHADRLLQLLGWTTRFHFSQSTAIAQEMLIPHKLLNLFTSTLDDSETSPQIHHQVVEKITSVYPSLRE